MVDTAVHMKLKQYLFGLNDVKQIGTAGKSISEFSDQISDHWTITLLN